MKKLVSLFISACLISSSAFAECDFSRDIIKNNDGSYNYSKECHIKVGEMKQDLDIANQQIPKLTQALDLKDLVIDKADQRADLWMNTSFKLEDRINTIDQMQKTNQWLSFGLGALAMFGATYAASKALGH